MTYYSEYIYKRNFILAKTTIKVSQLAKIPTIELWKGAIIWLYRTGYSVEREGDLKVTQRNT